VDPTCANNSKGQKIISISYYDNEIPCLYPTLNSNVLTQSDEDKFNQENKILYQQVKVIIKPFKKSESVYLETMLAEELPDRPFAV
jgi:hypothetical protein